MKIVVTSDWHLDAVTAGVPRLDDFEPYVEALADAIADENADFLIHAGDFFDPGTMLVSHYTARVIEWFRMFDDVTLQCVIAIAGNHDVIESSLGVTTLSPLAAAFPQNSVQICESPTLLCRDAIDVLALPYVTRAAEPKSIDGILALRRPEVPLIVVAHQTVPGAILGSETEAMPRGRDYDLPVDWLASLKPSVVINGHYHRRQTVKCANGLEILIPGSPHRFDFGERNDLEKGFLILEIDA